MQTLSLESGFRTAPNWPKIWKMAMTSQFFHFSIIFNFFYVALFLLLILVNAPSLMSISSLVLELWLFFLRGIYPISGDWGELWIPNLAQMSLIKSYWILKNTWVTAITPPSQTRVNRYIQKLTKHHSRFFRNR